MPATLRAAVRSSVLVLILILYVPCVAPISQNARGVSIPFFVGCFTHSSRQTEYGRWVHFTPRVTSSHLSARFNFHDRWRLVYPAIDHLAVLPRVLQQSNLDP